MSNLRAAHITSLQHAVAAQPSIFNILSQESLTTSLKPAIGHLIKFLAMVYSNRFQMAHEYYDELYLLFDLLLQNQYLKKYGASFSENFYEMKRIFSSTGKPPTDLNSRIRSLVFIVLWPYVRDKLEKWHSILTERTRYASATTKNLRIKLAQIFIRVWPILKASISLATTVFQLGYIIGRSTVHSPFLLLAGVRLEKLTDQDLESFEHIPMHLKTSGKLNRLWRFVLGFPVLFSYLFGYGLFFVQFIDFMYNTDIGMQLAKKDVYHIPPAPHKLLSESSVQLLDTNKCPLCLRRRKNDTALSVSGYVFCYICIYNHIKEFKRCPVTGLPATTNELIRLYIQ
ncbi:hypothetical protein KIN20_030978 [Parelaphostrongylus tenuis]|uniref:Peroxisome assembly protein 12 n=1 Tax=Parelaphostrongylus tenuis TaxID=148309 RepID=A0AAD5WGP7_PARTN|nr:hypothetical protein KIN20_030978 [Parelaphostrongylus tenuis]